ncbi:MAG: hypothetical protein GF365_04360 [Candidatus Buchananbacteria bacterium]|nr:hypothetical protein [Candidatus Buchananbacteria bacterium]
MDFKKIKVLKDDARGIMYDCDKLNFIERRKGTISADHKHIDPEILYLLKGEIKIIIGEDEQKIKSSVKIRIPANQYHKIIALTDIIILEDRQLE